MCFRKDAIAKLIYNYVHMLTMEMEKWLTVREVGEGEEGTCITSPVCRDGCSLDIHRGGQAEVQQDCRQPHNT